jgi:hypothetical protein
LALGKAGDIVTYTSPLDSSTHYGIVLDTLGLSNVIARNLGAKRNEIQWDKEEVVASTSIHVVSGNDALHG